MAAMKPRTGDGPMEVTKEARSYVMRIPLEGGGRLVVELNLEEATNHGSVLQAAVALVKKQRANKTPAIDTGIVKTVEWYLRKYN